MIKKIRQNSLRAGEFDCIFLISLVPGDSQMRVDTRNKIGALFSGDISLLHSLKMYCGINVWDVTSKVGDHVKIDEAWSFIRVYLCQHQTRKKIQNEAARIVTGATKLASIDSLHTETGWETLGSRRKNHKLTMFYKMKNGLCPDYLVSLVPATVGSASTYPLRNSSDLQTLHTNSRLYYTSFLPSHR